MKLDIDVADRKIVKFNVNDVSSAKMNIFEATIEGVAPIVFNKIPNLDKPKEGKKTKANVDHNALEHANWKDKLYVYDNGMLYVPEECIHQCMKNGAKHWGVKIPGQGSKTYTSLIDCSVMTSDIELGVHKEDNNAIKEFGRNVNGTPNKPTRAMVYKIRPQLPIWGGKFKIFTLDDRLTGDILVSILDQAGTYVGLCDWRPSFGRFKLIDLIQYA